MPVCKQRILTSLAAGCLLAISACDKSSSTTGSNPLPGGGAGDAVNIDGTRIGQRALEIEGKAIADGAAFQLSKLKGKVVLLDFWGTWCGPCRAAIPHEKKLAARFGNQTFALIGISINDSPDTLRKFVANNELTWPNVLDDKNTIAQQWQVEAVPTFVLIDADGFIIGRWEGAQDMPAIEKAIEAELKTLEKRK